MALIVVSWAAAQEGQPAQPSAARRPPENVVIERSKSQPKSGEAVITFTGRGNGRVTIVDREGRGEVVAHPAAIRYELEHPVPVATQSPNAPVPRSERRKALIEALERRGESGSGESSKQPSSPDDMPAPPGPRSKSARGG